MPKKLRLHQTGYYYKAIFIFHDPISNLPFMDSSKHSLSGILVQYAKQTKDDTKIKIPHHITYQSGTFQGS